MSRPNGCDHLQIIQTMQSLVFNIHCSSQIPRNSQYYLKLKCQILLFCLQYILVIFCWVNVPTHCNLVCQSVKKWSIQYGADLITNVWNYIFLCHEIVLPLLPLTALFTQLVTCKKITLPYKWNAFRTSCCEETHKKIFRGQLCSSSNVYVMIKVLRNEV